MIKSGAKDATDRNNYLNNLKLKVQNRKRSIVVKGFELTARNLKDAYLGNVKENRGIMEIFLEHNQKCEELSGKDFAPGTVERYITCRKHIGQFIRSKYRQGDLPVKSIDHRFIKELEHFFKTVRNCNHNTTVKYIVNFKKIIRMALAYGWIKTDPFKDISVGKDNRQWIKKKRRKTNKLSSIPLLGVPLGILSKYENDPECIRSGNLLPVLSNQKMNAYLKEIADLCGIEKKFTTHTARHTFATTVTLSNNISIEAVSEMLGHSSLNMTKKYARVVDDFLGREMGKIEKKFSNQSVEKHALLRQISAN
ncbi:MAG: site-specific integrase [Bacteroidales bacterium]|nr:site-specific integrase [Bacteroidales bacterium]